MSNPQRSSSKLGVCFVLLLCAGAGAWLYTQNSGKDAPGTPLQPAAVSMESAASKSAGGEAPAGGDPAQEGRLASELGKALTKAVQAVTSPTAGKKENVALEVTAPLNTGPRQRELGPEEAVMARVEKALAGEGTPEAGGASAGGTIAEAPVKAVERRQDSVVTGAFVKDLARWLTAGYVEPSHEGAPGGSTVTLMRTNARYSTSDTLRSVENDALKGRRSILNYVFTPGVLEVLYRLYSPVFLEELEKAAAAPRRGKQLDASQVADMFKVYADFMRRTAASLDAASALDLPSLLSDIHKAAAKEASAEEEFAKAYTAHAEARDAGHRAIMTELSQRMVQSARLASNFDAKEGAARQALAMALRQKATGPALSDADLVFLGEWLGRRKASTKSMVAAADICRRMAEQLESRAAGIEAPALQISLPEEAPRIEPVLAAPAPVLNVPEQPASMSIAEPVPSLSLPEAVQPVPAAAPTPVPAQ
ncbi:MAG: hypothetical protein IKJ34_05750 [Mailhella sp.]|nr:hypothetical protein [Mailhella sp.]